MIKSVEKVENRNKRCGWKFIGKFISKTEHLRSFLVLVAVIFIPGNSSKFSVMSMCSLCVLKYLNIMFDVLADGNSLAKQSSSCDILAALMIRVWSPYFNIHCTLSIYKKYRLEFRGRWGSLRYKALFVTGLKTYNVDIRFNAKQDLQIQSNRIGESDLYESNEWIWVCRA